MHPVDVAPQGVDLAVVGEEVIRMGAVPAGEGVGGEPGVHHGNGGLHGRVAQVRVVLVQLGRHQHPLVDHGAGRHAGKVPVGIDTFVAYLVEGPLLHDVELAVEGILVGTRRGALEEDLPNQRLARLGRIAQGGVVGRHLAPADDLDRFFGDDALEKVLGGAALGSLRRGEEHGDAVVPRGRQVDAGGGADLAEEGVGHLNQDPGAVARVVLAADCAAVIEVCQDRYGLLDDLVGLLPLDVGDEADAAGVMLELGIVHPLLLG